MSNKLRGMRRKITKDGLKGTVTMVPIFRPLLDAITLCAKDMNVEPIALIHNTLSAGVSSYMKLKEKDNLIVVPGMTLKDRMEQEAGSGKDE